MTLQNIDENNSIQNQNKPCNENISSFSTPLQGDSNRKRPASSPTDQQQTTKKPLVDYNKLNEGLQIPPISPINSPPSPHSSASDDSDKEINVDSESSVHENSGCSESESEEGSENTNAYSEGKKKVPPRIGRANSEITTIAKEDKSVREKTNHRGNNDEEDKRNNSKENNRPKVSNKSFVVGTSDNNANNLRSESASVRPKTQYRGNTANNISDNNSDSASAIASASASVSLKCKGKNPVQCKERA
ncbi:AAC-rich mRNA clone AAC11 protein-like [Palaemon carinicauda]|uniref:AAC-rich mRNA clone AAC11 protein-like n=1 Tax=Palaemon carinicauda TaxID=392227 RepID=UPI0035B64B2C